jgi:PAS domain S-box-containing protein
MTPSRSKAAEARRTHAGRERLWGGDQAAATAGGIAGVAAGLALVLLGDRSWLPYPFLLLAAAPLAVLIAGGGPAVTAAALASCLAAVAVLLSPRRTLLGPGHLALVETLAYLGLMTLVIAAQRARMPTRAASLHEATERHLEEQQLLLDSMPAMLWLKDTENRILRLNKPAADTIGLPVEAVEGQSTFDLYPDDAGKYFADDLEVIRTGKPSVGIVEQHPRADGNRIWVRTDKLPYRDINGNIAGVIVFAIDISDLKRAENELQMAHDQLLRAEIDRKSIYQEVIRAVTRDRLRLVEPHEIPNEGEPLFSTQVDTPEGYADLRDCLRRVGAEAEMQPARIDDLVLVSGEVATNAIKHAVAGMAFVHRELDRIVVRVSDRGPGIRPEHLPATILQAGFSTTVSLGMGFTLMLELVDRLWLATGPGGTVVQLEMGISKYEDPDSLLPPGWETL